jgi:hypothetical protein
VFGSPGEAVATPNPLCDWPEVYIPLQQERSPDRYFDLDDPNAQQWMTHAGDPQPRPRPEYKNIFLAMQEQQDLQLETSSILNTMIMLQDKQSAENEHLA